MAESAQITALRAKIAEAEDALHALMTGNKPTEVTFGVNRGTKWAQANPDKLRGYIEGLKVELAGLLGTSASGRRGPIYPTGGAR